MGTRWNGKRRGRWAGILLWLLAAGLLLAAGAPVAHADDQNQYWDQDDVTITIHADSTFAVSERQGFVFDSGSFHGSWRDINTDKLTDLADVTVSEEGYGPYTVDDSDFDLDAGVYPPPHTYQVVDRGDHKQVIWFYDPFDAPARKTMVITYTVTGGLRFYPQGDMLDWSPFMPERYAGDIEHATLTVQMPDDVTLTGTGVHTQVNPGGAGHVQLTDHQAVFTTDKTLKPAGDNAVGDRFEAILQWPHGLISGSPAAWQTTFDNSYAQKWQPGVTLGVLILALLVGVVGPLFWLGRWYFRGRDPFSGLVASTINEPPSDLPAGLVGTLLDESADQRDVIATLFDLGRRGNLRIEQLAGTANDFQVTLLNAAALLPHEQKLIAALFPGEKRSVQLSQVRGLDTKLAAIYTAMYQALVDQKYFDHDPDDTRTNYYLGSCSLLGLGLLAIPLAIFASGLSPLLWALVPAFLACAVVGMILARSMPRKTVFGAQQTTRWRAFGRYLTDLQRFGNLPEAAKRFGDYLPYAIALGLEEQYVQQFQSADSQAPLLFDYYVPLGVLDAVTDGARHGGGGGGSGGLDLSPGGLNKLNAGVVGAVSGLNVSIAGMINSTSDALTRAAVVAGSAGGDAAGAVLGGVLGIVADVALGGDGGGGGGSGGSF